jgi:hypothetical protein
MSEYIPVDPLTLHPSTHELVQRQYLVLRDCYPNCTPVQQLYNSVMHFAPDLPTAIASIQQASKSLLADMRAYPDEAEKLARALPYLADFCECVQETSAKLHNGEQGQREAIEALNRLHAESQQREAERQQQWLAEVAAGDAYFGGPGAYQRARDEHYAALDAKEYAASGERLRTFRDAYHRGEIPQPEAAPVQAGLWEVGTR